MIYIYNIIINIIIKEDGELIQLKEYKNYLNNK